MRSTPPHILVTTPESLYMLLTSESADAHARHRAHGDRRRDPRAGRQQARRPSGAVARAAGRLARKPPVRIGLSATQNPIERRWPISWSARATAVHIVDHRPRTPRATSRSKCRRRPLEAVMSNEVWGDLRPLAALSSRTPHHADLRQHAPPGRARCAAPQRAAGRGRGHRAPRQPVEGAAPRRRAAAEGGRAAALVATASLELGIDIGEVDLVCQLGSPRSIATLLQRVGRSGHSVGGLPKGRLFPLERDDLAEMRRCSMRCGGASSIG
jgi:ATP-dependent Lhr-like helicase